MKQLLLLITLCLANLTYCMHSKKSSANTPIISYEFVFDTDFKIAYAVPLVHRKKALEEPQPQEPACDDTTTLEHAEHKELIKK